MKILLLGEFSAYHYNLKDGLIELGHDVVIASTGDEWKNIPKDIDINYAPKWINNKLAIRIFQFIQIKKFIGYDIVQIMSPDTLFKRYFPRNLFFDILKKYNKKIFLIGGGSDAYYWKYGRKRLRYGPFEDNLKYDLKSTKHRSESKKYIEFNEYIANSVDGIIPIMYEYEISYFGHKNLLNTIPIPINTNKIKYEKNKLNKKLTILHGLNRYGYKGTRYVEEAFKILKKKYRNSLELIIDGHMPLKKYLKLMKKSNIVIDQTSSYSLGVNGVYSLAMGKVVVGGAEPESLKSIGVNSSPVINIKPNVKNIVDSIEKLIDNKNKIEDIGFQSRKFAEEVHGHIKIAKKFIETWETTSD